MPEFTLTIKYDTATRACGVTGPVMEPALCFAMLGEARRVVERFQESRRGIVVVKDSAPLRVVLPSGFSKG